ncbi:MAG: efflux transporter outer membrane subunit [Prevotella sp.]|jgi:NodT family efflux transporter outer membrane factor (OMF) lipoprotein|nr:efflux transporter outer membrane subunit [Prevotella sp.]MCR5153078.1 efflux transporter outer membrane subunit [Prevotella sp.]
MKKTNIIIALVAVVALSGCSSYRNLKNSLYAPYERPEIRTDSVYRDTGSADGVNVEYVDTLSFGNLPWREVFTDPLLQQHIQKALDNNVNMLNAALNIKMAEEQLKVARLAFLPQFTFNPQGGISKLGNADATKYYTLPVVASWNVNLFGGLTSQKRAAQVQLLAARDYQLAVQTSLVSNVANMYYTLLMLDKQLQIVNDMTVLTKETWDMMKLQMEFGRARSTSVQSAEANYYSVQTQAVDIQRQIRETENALSLVMGEPAHGIARGTLENQSLPAKFATGIGIQLLNNRPDVHAYEMQLAQCFYNIETARSRFYPSITISPSGAFTNNNGMINPGKILLSAVASLTQPIFMNGQLTAGLRVAEAQYQQALNDWQNSVLQAGSEVSNALVLYNSSAEKSALEAQQIATLEKNVEHTQLLFRQSSSTYLEVITAQQNLLNARISKVSDDFYKMQAVVNLYYALGGGTQ